MDNVLSERYRELACACIEQGINDWLGNKLADDYELYKWLQDCTWFDYLGLDREYFYVKVLKMKRKGIKKLRRNKYGKPF